MDCLGILSQVITNVVTSVFTSVISPCLSPILVCITYPFTTSDNIRALELATDELKARQKDVLNKVKTAQLQGFTQKNEVIEWLNRVEKIKGEVDEISKRYRERSQCFGSQSFNCWSNCWISNDANEKLKDVQKEYNKGKFEEVATELPPQVEEFRIESMVVPKEEADLRKIGEYIDNDQKNIFGIWGMGGVGKTRLLKLVFNKYRGSSAFDVVAFVTASKEYSVENIQAQLRQKCGFHKAESVESQATIISDNLKNCNFLILLDDVWGKIDLEVVGIPLGLGDQLKKKKVVITTRLLSVFGLMRVKQSLNVHGLDHEHALRLFKENVGDETINSDPRIPSLAVKVVKELDGLPLALITIGQSMSNKRDPNVWNHTINLLEKSGLNEIDGEKKIFHKLKLSYDNMNSKKLKNCFLVCSLWPEDCLIEKIDLIECWLGLGLLDLDISNARNIYDPGYDVIGKLLSSCLLEKEGSKFVKMHDIIRDMALWIAHDEGKKKDKWVVLTRNVLNPVPHENICWPNVEGASLILRPEEIFDALQCERVVNDQPIPCHANKLKFLRVHFYISRIETLVQNLRSFCGLAFLDLRSCELISFPQGISNLSNLKYLNLSDNKITSVPEELNQVRNLRYLSLQYNPIDSFSKGVLSELKELRVLDLYTSGSGGVEYLTWLIKELDCLGNMRCLNIKLQQSIHFRSLLELPNLPVRLLSLDYENETDILEIPNSFIGNTKIQDNLYKLQLAVRSVSIIVIRSYDQKGQLGNLEFLSFYNMRMLETIKWPRNIAPEVLLPILSTLEFSDCDKLKDISWTLYLPNLRILALYDCGKIVQLIEHVGGSRSATKPTFPSLINLTLHNLPNMQIICDQSITFPSLEELWIRKCPKLKKLPFQSNTVPRKLRYIHIKSECWERLEWEDNNLKQDLESFTYHSTYIHGACSIM